MANFIDESENAIIILFLLAFAVLIGSLYLKFTTPSSKEEEDKKNDETENAVQEATTSTLNTTGAIVNGAAKALNDSATQGLSTGPTQWGADAGKATLEWLTEFFSPGNSASSQAPTNNVAQQADSQQDVPSNGFPTTAKGIWDYLLFTGN